MNKNVPSYMCTQRRFSSACACALGQIQSLLCALWIAKYNTAQHGTFADSEDFDQTALIRS